MVQEHGRLVTKSFDETLDRTDREAINSFKDMLSFFGVELQSHAAVVLGLGLLVFAIVQAWGQLASASRLPDWHAVTRLRQLKLGKLRLEMS